MGKIKKNKKLGIGSMSLVISVFAIMFQFTYFSERSIGEEILYSMEINFPVLIISLILFFISIIIGYKNKDDRYAESGITLSVGFIILIVITSIVSVLFLNR